MARKGYQSGLLSAAQEKRGAGLGPRLNQMTLTQNGVI